MRGWWRWTLLVLAVLLVVLGGLAWWLVQGFDGERFKRAASDWMRTHHDRALVFDGPVRLRLWPQPTVAVQQVRLSEPGRPEQRFASVDSASLSLRMRPLLWQREIHIDRVSAQGLNMLLRRDAGGRRNVDDLLEIAAGGGGGADHQASIEHLELSDLQLQIDDEWSGVHGRMAIERLELGAFGRGLRSPLQLRARAELTHPRLSAALELDAGLQLLPGPRPGAPPIMQLDKAAMHLRGQGLQIEGLDARLRAESIRFEYGAAEGTGDSRAELEHLKLQFGGRHSDWHVDRGDLQLARLQLDMAQRSLDLRSLVLQLDGGHEQSTLAAKLSWPALSVQGDRLQGSALEGQLQIGGERPLVLQLHSQAPSGRFEHITVPGLELDIDGRRGSSTLKGQARGTLVLEPHPLAASFDALSLRLQLQDPALPLLRTALDGEARLTPTGGSGRLAGTVNDQRVDAQLQLQLDRERPMLELQARFDTLDLDRFAPPPNGVPPANAAPLDLQPLRLADARLNLSAERLLRAPYRVDGLQLQARVANGVLDLQRATGRAWGGRFDARGSADAGSGNLALWLQAEGVDVRTLLADTLGFDGLRGRGRVEAELHSRGTDFAALRAGLNGSVQLSLQPAALRGVDLAQALRGWRTASESGSDKLDSSAARQTEFSQLDGSFVLRNGVARSDDLDGRSDFLRVGGEGTVDLAQGRLDYLLRARVHNTASGRAGPEMLMLNGVTVPVQLNGPFGQIEWQVNWAAVTAAVAAMSVPNVARGAVGTAARGATGVVRGAAGLLRALPGAAASAPR